MFIDPHTMHSNTRDDLIVKVMSMDDSLPKQASLGLRALRGLVMILAQSVVARVCSLGSQLALAALLSPADFGLIGLAYGITTIVSTLTNLGVEDVILQRKRTLHLWSGTAFWINLSLALAGGTVTLLLAPIANVIYRSDQMTGLMAVLALAMPIGALSSVPDLIMRSEMKFGVFAVYGSLEVIATALMSVGLAWAGFGAYSFVIPAPVTALCRAVVYWSLMQARPRLSPHGKRWKYLVRNTAASFTSKIIISIIGQGDYMVLGLLATQTVVGRYYFGFRLAAQPLWILAGNLAGILYPTLIQLDREPERQGDAAFRATVLLSYVVMPLAFIQAAVAGPVLQSFFGDKWSASVPIIQVLSIGLALDAMSWVAGALLAARGEFIAGLRYISFQLPLFFLLVTIGGLWDQALGVAWAVCLFYGLSQPVFVYSVYRRVGVTKGRVALMYGLPLCYAAFATGAGLLIAEAGWFSSWPLVRAAVTAVVASFTYAMLVRIFACHIWSQVVRHLARLLKR